MKLPLHLTIILIALGLTACNAQGKASASQFSDENSRAEKYPMISGISCANYTYSSCPASCVAMCISSACSGGGSSGATFCTSDCDGHGSCKTR